MHSFCREFAYTVHSYDNELNLSRTLVMVKERL
ncbi:hypothetical protein ROA7450_01709 [Roseovarius albus]|uniref:Uncharacterized protein n=1 Tax=Roseovarius albus TaxID=1247867 RepID=A0A1X6YZY5_9RHOB|nr:hypothetical protein ROA7450_01709 [Roseovarius albus]